jgi:hypothetical protein
MQTRVPAHILEVHHKYSQGRRNLIDVPELPGQVLRRRNIAGSAETVGLRPTKFLQIAEKHFDRLRDEKLAIPEFTFYLDKPGWRWHRAPRHASLYTVVDAVKGKSLEGEPLEILLTEPFRLHARRVADAFSNYFDWVDRTHQKLYLDDVTPHRQFMLGTIATASEAGEQLYMVDVDPSLHEIDDPIGTAWARTKSELAIWEMAAG